MEFLYHYRKQRGNDNMAHAKKIAELETRLARIQDELHETHKDIVRYVQNSLNDLRELNKKHNDEVNQLVQLGTSQNGHDEKLRMEVQLETVAVFIRALEKTVEDFRNLGVKGYEPHYPAVLK